jgi:hypothetical protein
MRKLAIFLRDSCGRYYQICRNSSPPISWHSRIGFQEAKLVSAPDQRRAAWRRPLLRQFVTKGGAFLTSSTTMSSSEARSQQAKRLLAPGNSARAPKLGRDVALKILPDGFVFAA